MVIGFKPMFAGPIMEGTKIHTIREDKHNRWKAGMIMHMANGVRTKHYHNFKTITCTGFQRIEMQFLPDNQDVLVTVAGRPLTLGEINDLAIKDGFTNLVDFFNWWMPVISKLPRLTYQGKIIHWTDFRY